MIPRQKTIKIGNTIYELGKVYGNPRLTAFKSNNEMVFEIKQNIETFPDDIQFHLRHDIPLSESIYRPQSEKFWGLIRSFRKYVNEGHIKLNNEIDRWIVETDIGNTGIYEGKEVYLDVPFVVETDDSLELQHLKLLNKSMKMMPNSPSQKKVIRQLNQVRNKLGLKPLKEADYQGKEVELNKPKRSSGPKKYQVYVKNDKGNVIKVNFGDETGGLTTKLNDPEARKQFASRHNCKDKKDKTKAGYWSCHLPRYWSLLGGDKDMNTYW